MQEEMKALAWLGKIIMLAPLEETLLNKDGK